MFLTPILRVLYVTARTRAGKNTTVPKRSQTQTAKGERGEREETRSLRFLLAGGKGRFAKKEPASHRIAAQQQPEPRTAHKLPTPTICDDWVARPRCCCGVGSG